MTAPVTRMQTTGLALRAGRGAALLVAAAVLSACAGELEPRRVEAAAPTVTYAYATDAQLLGFYNQAQGYCRRYDAVPDLLGEIQDRRARGKTVTFRCDQVQVRPSAMAPAPINAPYSTDRGLIQALHAATEQCARAGFASTAQIVAESAGVKRVQVQCSRMPDSAAR